MFDRIFTFLTYTCFAFILITSMEDLGKIIGLEQMDELGISMVFAFFTIGSIIIPTQHELMVIYGLGGTIDYIKSNDKAKELPDKVVNALTRYIDYVEKEKNH